MSLTKVSYSMINTTEVHVVDFGAVGDGVADDTAAIQAAIDAGDLIYFDAGKTYKITSTLNLSAGNKTLIGNEAIIDQRGIVAGNKWAMRAVGGLSATTSNLTVNAPISSYSATVTSATGFAVGDWVLIHSDAHYDFYNSVSYLVDVGEFVRIRSIVGNVISFTTPTSSSSYNTADTARLTKVNFCENINIYGLIFQGSNTAGGAERGVVLQYVNGFNLEECQFIEQDIYQLELSMSIRGNVTDNRFYGVFYDGSTGTIFYGLVVLDSSQYINIGDNIFERVRHGVTTTAKSGGQGAFGQPLYINIHHNQMLDAMAGGPGRSWGFEHHGFGLYISFNNNMVNGGYGGVNIDAGFGCEIIDNVFTNISHYGIEMGGSANRIGNILISGNHVSRETNEIIVNSYGIYVNDAIVTSVNDVVISDNFVIGFDRAASSGIYISNTPTSRNVVVKNNTLSTGTSGQDADSGYAIVNYAPETEIIGNTIMNYRQGIYVDDGAGQVVVKGNVLRYDVNPTVGIGIYCAGDNVTIDSNTLIRPFVGIRADTTANASLITNNTMKGVVNTAISDLGTSTLLANNNNN
jgi:hypothetical protein